MSEKNIVVYRLDPDNPKGLSDETKARLDAMTDDDIERAAAADPDCPIFTEEELDAFPDGIDPLDMIHAEKDFQELISKYPPEIIRLVSVTVAEPSPTQ